MHKLKIRYTVSILLGLLLLFLVADVVLPPPVSIPYSQTVTAEDGTVIHAFLSRDDKWRMMTELQEISPSLRKAIIYKEDKYFYWHFGVNPVAVIRAAVNNILYRKKTSGASTITMQVARLLEPKRRTLLGKCAEMFRAVQLECRYSKEEILQLYLNLVPYGGNIEGVKAASILYFGRMPTYLSIAQIVTLSIIPNRPTSLQIGSNNEFLCRERDRWLRRLGRDGVFPTMEIQDAIREPLGATRHEVPKSAPHYALRLKSRYPDRVIIKTRLRMTVQEKVELLAYNYIQRLRFRNINNASVLVIDNKDRSVVAYLGSPDYGDREHSGQVDGVKAVRSPGSTLKPLLYAIAMDKGVITPKSVIADVPVNFDGYTPENFDEHYHGNVTIEKALAYSLNVPAVKTLSQIGVLSLIDKLKQANFTQIRRDEGKLGLSTILGGCGVRLEELTNLFSCFANEGRYAALTWLKQDTATAGFSLISDAAAFMVTDILTQMSRPDLPHNYESSAHVPKVAWKTGTSYGRRDAWSIGYNKRYTVGVWIGNFNAVGVPDLTGADAATPLLFDIFNALEYNSGNEWFFPPKSLDFRLVCSESGMVPNTFCENQVTDYYIPSVSSNQKCEHLKSVWVSEDEAMSYCTSCLPATGAKKMLYPNYAPELLSFFQSEHIAYKAIPEHNPSCSRILKSLDPVITSPVNGKEYILEKGEGQELMLSGNVDNQVQKVYWFINDRLYRTAQAGESVFFVPPGGQTKISCSDDRGRNSNIWITVSYR